MVGRNYGEFDQSTLYSYMKFSNKKKYEKTQQPKPAILSFSSTAKNLPRPGSSLKVASLRVWFLSVASSLDFIYDLTHRPAARWISYCLIHTQHC